MRISTSVRPCPSTSFPTARRSRAMRRGKSAKTSSNCCADGPRNNGTSQSRAPGNQAARSLDRAPQPDRVHDRRGRECAIRQLPDEARLCNVHEGCVDSAVGNLAFGEIAVLHRKMAEIIERHGADLAQLADEEVGQRLGLLRCHGHGPALLGVRFGRHRCWPPVHLRRSGPVILLDLWLCHGRRTALMHRFGHRGPAILLWLGRWTALVLNLGGNGPAVLFRLGRRSAMMLGFGPAILRLGLRRRATIAVRLSSHGPAVLLGLRRRTALVLGLGPAILRLGFRHARLTARLRLGWRRCAAPLILHRRRTGQPPVLDFHEPRHGLELGLQVPDLRLMLPLQLSYQILELRLSRTYLLLEEAGTVL